MDRRAVADGLPAGRGRVRIERGGHEDRAPVGIEIEDLRRVGRQPEAVILGPQADLVAAAAQDRDVERVDRLQDHLGFTGRLAPGGGIREEGHRRRIGLLHETLERPVTAAHHVGRDAGQQGDRSEGAASGELEGRDVVLDAVVIAGEGRGAEQVDGAMGPMSPPQANAGGGDSVAAAATNKSHGRRIDRPPRERALIDAAQRHRA